MKKTVASVISIEIGRKPVTNPEDDPHGPDSAALMAGIRPAVARMNRNPRLVWLQVKETRSARMVARRYGVGSDDVANTIADFADEMRRRAA